MKNSGVDWSKLNNPKDFFSLQDGFSLVELKKKYKEYIKKYKPDSFPEEFKKIRFAYESLQDQLNEGDLFLSKELGQASVANDLDVPDASGANHVRSDWLENCGNFDQIFSDLKSALSAKNCLYLAALSDVHETGYSHFYWLVKGLRYINPSEYYYYEFVSSFAESEPVEENWVTSLIELSEDMSVEIFYQFLYPIFSTMLNELNYESVLKCLQVCEKKLSYRGDYISYKCQIYLMFLSENLKESNESTVDQVLQFLVENKVVLNDEQYETLEFYQNVLSYYKFKEKYMNETELYDLVNTLIQSYLDVDEERCREIIFQIKKKLRMNFAYNELYFSSDFDEFLILIYRICKFVIEGVRHILDFADESERVVLNRANQFNQFVKIEYSRQPRWHICKWAINSGFANVIVTAFSLMLVLLFKNIWELQIIVGVSWLASLFCIYRYYEVYITSRLMPKFTNWFYSTIMRKKLFDFILGKNMLLEYISVLPKFSNEKEIVLAKEMYEKVLEEKFYYFSELFVGIK